MMGWLPLRPQRFVSKCVECAAAPSLFFAPRFKLFVELLRQDQVLTKWESGYEYDNGDQLYGDSDVHRMRFQRSPKMTLDSHSPKLVRFS